MPAKSAKQEKFMQAVAHNKAFAKKVGVPQSVGKEYTMKKTKKYADAGTVVNPRAARFTQRATDMNNRVTTRVADMTARKATMPTDRQAQFQSNIDRYKAKGAERVAKFTAKATAANTAGKAMGGPLVNRQPKEKKYAAGGTTSRGGPSTPGKTTLPRPVIGGSGKPRVTPTRPGFPSNPTGGSTRPGISDLASRVSGVTGKAKGGQLSKADGIAKKGKTHTAMPKMAKGGYKKGGKC